MFVMKPVADYAGEAPAATFWDRRCARGAITVLAGDGGIGKSTVAANLMAAITGTGQLVGWGDGDETPRGSVAIISYEDWGRVIEARNAVLGADNRRVFNIEGRTYVDRDGNESFDAITTADIRDLSIELERIDDLVLLVIDPWKDLVVDINKPDIVNPVLTALATTAVRLQIAVLLVAHHNADGGLAGYKGLHQKARSVLECKQLEASDTVTKVAMAQTKSNLGAKAPTLLYEYQRLPDKRGWHTGDNPFSWAGTSTMSGEYLMRQKKRTQVQEAEDWLRTTLMSESLTYAELVLLAEAEHYSEHTLRRARGNVCVEDGRKDGKPLWTLK
jgi:hypothetical protein